MAQTPVVCPRQPLPRSLDVDVTISRPQTEIATDMTMLAFLTTATTLPPNGSRVKYYTSLDNVITDFGVNSQAYLAASAFFSRSDRPLRMAIGAVFEDPVPAAIMAGKIDFTALKAVTDGAFDMTINGVLQSIDGLDFSTATTISEVVTVLAAKMTGVAVSEKYKTLVIESSSTGDGSTIDYAAAPATGTDVSALLGLTAATGAQLWQGYTPAGLVAEAGLVADASKCNGYAIYGWTLDAKFRDTQEQKDFAQWIEARDPAITCLVTNSALAYNAQDTTNIGYFCMSNGLTRTAVMYHHNAQSYPDVSYLALGLSVNYQLPDSTLTMKFKQLPGIEPSTITLTELDTLNSRRINCYVRMGNNSDTVREGVQSADTWYTDSIINLDNYQEELQVEIFNVFMRNPKVPYTAAGQDKLISACQKINRRYERNGTFAPREIESNTSETGYVTLPATNIVPVPVSLATASERASRLAPPIAIVAYETGAFHKVNIAVNVYN